MHRYGTVEETAKWSPPGAPRGTYDSVGDFLFSAWVQEQEDARAPRTEPVIRDARPSGTCPFQYSVCGSYWYPKHLSHVREEYGD